MEENSDLGLFVQGSENKAQNAWKWYLQVKIVYSD